MLSALELKIPPLMVFILVAAGMIYLRMLYPSALISLPVITFAGVIIGVFGVALIGLGTRALTKTGTTVNPLKPENASHLTTGGIYAWTRNPIYLGLLFMLIGLGFYLQNPLTLLGVLVFVPYMNRFQIKPEERALVELFGAKYIAYQGQVRRWL